MGSGQQTLILNMQGDRSNTLFDVSRLALTALANDGWEQLRYHIERNAE